MPRVLRTLKDINDNYVEVYISNCISCNAEIATPKILFEKIKDMLPNLIKKLNDGDYCQACVIDLEKKGIKIIDNNDVEEMKQAYKKLKNEK